MTGTESTPAGAGIGADIGGTFTDIVLVDADGRRQHPQGRRRRRTTTAGDRRGLRDAARERELRPGDLRRVVHGTTVATNAILEYKGAQTAC